MLLQSVRNICKSILPQIGSVVTKTAFSPSAPILSAVASRSFHLLMPTATSLAHNSIMGIGKQLLAAPALPQLTQRCGFKVKGRLRRRCKDCYFVMRQGRLYNLCNTHPRHKQMSMVKKPKNTWILTHATQSKVRPW